jgi:hypothetical protein
MAPSNCSFHDSALACAKNGFDATLWTSVSKLDPSVKNCPNAGQAQVSCAVCREAILFVRLRNVRDPEANNAIQRLGSVAARLASATCPHG